MPVACPIEESEAVSDGHSRTARMVVDLWLRWSLDYDKPVPKLIVRARA